MVVAMPGAEVPVNGLTTVDTVCDNSGGLDAFDELPPPQPDIKNTMANKDNEMVFCVFIFSSHLSSNLYQFDWSIIYICLKSFYSEFFSLTIDLR
jgi:hypothetical protein